MIHFEKFRFLAEVTFNANTAIGYKNVKNIVTG